MTSSRRRVIWAYDREHLLHPFIVMGLNTLAGAGWDVTVVSADRAEGAAYRSFDAFSFERRVRNFQHLVFKVRGELEQAAIRKEHARQKIQKKLDREGARLGRRKRLSMRTNALKLEVAKQAIMAWRAVLKDFGAWRRLTYDTWLIYVRGFLRLLQLQGDVMIAACSSSPRTVNTRCWKLRTRRSNENASNDR